MYSRKFLRALVAEVISIAVVIGLNFTSSMAQSNPEGNIYAYDSMRHIEAEIQLSASTIWENVKRLDEVAFVTSEKAYSVIILIHPYPLRIPLDPANAEWVVVISSIPKIGEELKVVIVRLDYYLFDLKGIAKLTYPVEKVFSLDEVIPLMEEELRLNRVLHSPDACSYNPDDGGCYVLKKDVQLLGGNYIYTQPPCDFGGKIIVNKYAGKPIFFVTEWYMDSGRLLIPPCTPIPERNIYIKGIGTTGKVDKEFRMPVRIENAPCEVNSFDFEVTYDPNTFSYTGVVEPGELTESFEEVKAQRLDTGRLRVEGHTEEHGIRQGAGGYLVWLKFKFKNVQEDACYPFHLENLGGDIAHFSKTGGFLRMRCDGDVTGDGFITPRDALLAFQCYLGTGPCLDCSDFDRVGGVTPEDAEYMFRRYLYPLPPCRGKIK